MEIFDEKLSAAELDHHDFLSKLNEEAQIGLTEEEIINLTSFPFTKQKFPTHVSSVSSSFSSRLAVTSSISAKHIHGSNSTHQEGTTPSSVRVARIKNEPRVRSGPKSCVFGRSGARNCSSGSSESCPLQNCAHKFHRFRLPLDLRAVLECEAFRNQVTEILNHYISQLGFVAHILHSKAEIHISCPKKHLAAALQIMAGSLILYSLHGYMPELSFEEDPGKRQ